MEIIKDNYNNKLNTTTPCNIGFKYKRTKLDKFTFVCDNCNSEVKIDTAEDLEELNADFYWSGLMYLKCPCCGEMTLVDKDFEFTKNDMMYPKHFTHYESVEAVHIEDCKVHETIRELIERLNNNRELGIIYTECGDTFILVQRLEDDKQYWVFVSTKHVDCNVNFANDDY